MFKKRITLINILKNILLIILCQWKSFWKTNFINFQALRLSLHVNQSNFQLNTWQLHKNIWNGANIRSISDIWFLWICPIRVADYWLVMGTLKTFFGILPPDARLAYDFGTQPRNEIENTNWEKFLTFRN